MANEKGNPVSANLVALYFLSKAQEKGEPITNKKLQKLLYYAQAWHLVHTGKSLFEEEIQAWIHGPAIPSVYHEYKEFGYKPITTVVDEASLTTVPAKKLLDEVWAVYGKHDAEYLELLSHSEAPWQKAREGVPEDLGCSNVIKLSDMITFYSKKLEKQNT